MQKRENSIVLATLGSCSDGGCDRLYGGPLWKRWQRGGNPVAQFTGLPWIRCCRFPPSCNDTEHAGCLQGILALPVVRLGDRVVEHRHRNPRDCGWLLTLSLRRRQTIARSYRPSGSRVRSLLSLLSQRSEEHT